MHDSGVKLSIITLVNFLKDYEDINSFSVYKVGFYRKKPEINPLRWLNKLIRPPSNTRLMAKMALKVHEKHPIDVMNAFHSTDCGLAATYVKAKTKIPVIFNPISGLRHLFLRPPQLRNFPRFRNLIKKSSIIDRSFTELYNIFEKRYFQRFPVILKQSDLIVVPSNASKRDVLYFGADPEKIIKVPFAVDINEFSPKNMPHKDLERLKERKSPLLLFVGRLSITEKAVDEVLKAFKLIRKAFPDAGLVIVGDGPDKNILIHLSYALGLTGSVFFLGSKKHSEIPNILSAADALLFPFRLDSVGLTADTFGRVIIEGMSCGKVVITTNAEPFKEIVENNKDGFLVNPNDYRGLAEVACKVLSDEFQKKSIEKNARRKVIEHYRFPVIIKELKKTYKQVIGS